MSPTSTTISAHIDFGVRDVVIHTPQPALHIRDVTLRTPDPVVPSIGGSVGAGNIDGDNRVSTGLRSHMDVVELHQDYGEPEFTRHCSREGAHSGAEKPQMPQMDD